MSRFAQHFPGFETGIPASIGVNLAPPPFCPLGDCVVDHSHTGDSQGRKGSEAVAQVCSLVLNLLIREGPLPGRGVETGKG